MQAVGVTVPKAVQSRGRDLDHVVRSLDRVRTPNRTDVSFHVATIAIQAEITPAVSPVDGSGSGA